MPSFEASLLPRPEPPAYVLLPECDLPAECSSSKASLISALDRPAAQSAKKRLIEGMQAVMMLTFRAAEVQMLGVTAS